jgi:hypothetical protein
LWFLQSRPPYYSLSIEIWVVAEHIPARPIELARGESTAVRITLDLL